MDPVSTASSLVSTSLQLFDRVNESYQKCKKISEDVASIKEDLKCINRIIRERSENANRDGIDSWIGDLCRIKLRMKDTVCYYNLEFTTERTREWEGWAVGFVDRTWRYTGPEKKLLGYLDEIKKFITDAKERAEIYLKPTERRVGETTFGNKEDYNHPNEADPVGLETPTTELVEMLRDATLLRVVSIFRNSDLAEAAYNEVKDKEEEEFQCKAWVTPSHDDGEKKLLQAILDQLGASASHQESQNLIDLRQILKTFLKEKRYIIGIAGLETAGYWTDFLKNAFPDDKMSSRIIVATTNEEVAQACRKNCTIFNLEAPGKVVQMLSRGKDGAKKCRVVALLGPGGCGKSILAEAAYNKVQVEEDFEHKAWSKATENVDNLLMDILRQLGEQNLDATPSRLLIKRLKDLLCGKRYIIGIDGLDTTTFWNDVVYACPDNGYTGSRIIVTTTKKEIASSCRRYCPVYTMHEALDERTAHALLVRKVFREDGCPDNVTRKNLAIILETCEYFPLAIANTGDYMRGLNQDRDWNYEECKKLHDCIGSLMVDKNRESFRGMRHVFNRSYTSLNDNAKACLLSLSLYSNDDEIKAKPLIRRLLAEELISPAENLVKECLAPLIEHNFIVPKEFSVSGHVKIFRVNNMLLQFIKEKGGYENNVTRIDIQQGLEVKSDSDITRLYLHNNSSSESPGIGMNVDLTHVQLLTFHGKASKALMRFDSYTFLRVLILENCESMTNDNLHTVWKPAMLKYLSIRGNRGVTKLPKKIAKMQLLETLDIRDTEIHELLMRVILGPPKLAHLFGKFKITCTDKDVDSFKKVKICPLQTLAGFIINESPDFVKFLTHMTMLSKVNILWRQTALNNDGSDNVKKDLVKYLNSCFMGPTVARLRYLSFDFDVCDDLDFLNRLQNPICLRSLKLCGKLTIIPSWLTSHKDMDFFNIVELCLSGCNIGHLSDLQCLKQLAFLKLTEGSTEDDSRKQNIWCNGWFENLKRLRLDFLILPKIVIEEKAMQNLQSLHLSCEYSDGFDGIKNLLNLEELIFPSRATIKDTERLLNQVKTLPQRPRVHRRGSVTRKFNNERKFPGLRAMLT